MDPMGMEEYSMVVVQALSALPDNQLRQMYAERINESGSSREVMISDLDTEICDNAACGTEESREELYTLIQLLAHKPVKPRYTCPECGSSDVHVSCTMNPNKDEEPDFESDNHAHCNNCESDDVWEVRHLTMEGKHK
jgi:transcription elongation factor Elf1